MPRYACSRTTATTARASRTSPRTPGSRTGSSTTTSRRRTTYLRTIFVENWGELIGRFRAVEAAAEPAHEKIEGIAKILLRTWRNDPALVTVMVREVARSQQIQGQVEDVGEAFPDPPAHHRGRSGNGSVPARHRRAPRKLGRVRGARRGAHRVGARAAAGRRGRGRSCRENRDRCRPLRSFEVAGLSFRGASARDVASLCCICHYRVTPDSAVALARGCTGGWGASKGG